MPNKNKRVSIRINIKKHPLDYRWLKNQANRTQSLHMAIEIISNYYGTGDLLDTLAKKAANNTRFNSQPVQHSSTVTARPTKPAKRFNSTYSTKNSNQSTHMNKDMINRFFGQN